MSVNALVSSVWTLPEPAILTILNSLQEKLANLEKLKHKAGLDITYYFGFRHDFCTVLSINNFF